MDPFFFFFFVFFFYSNFENLDKDINGCKKQCVLSVDQTFVIANTRKYQFLICQ